ncbi:hypothetical protein [Massilia sp. CCM 8734]|uniref:hypothetical protein n=1 Tax=Massilia sp. CCM 8734 TaxID=2609283 RepID=UPI00141FCE6D|nr:hypothetical protein [Massilia sp. CCM 8734]NIA01025.1 hypothetical protein [Massilia sp. CCM 8734]
MFTIARLQRSGLNSYDFLLKWYFSPDQLKQFLCKIFDCPAEKILVFNLDEFNSLVEVLDYPELVCICVYTEVQGDVSQLLRLYRRRLPTSIISEKIISAALTNKVQCYIPEDCGNTWIYVEPLAKLAERMKIAWQRKRKGGSGRPFLA